MAIYEKNLTEDFRLRLSVEDMEFLRRLSSDRAVSVSECVRSIIGEYRRSLDAMEVLKKALEMAKTDKEGTAVHGYTKTDLNDLV